MRRISETDKQRRVFEIARVELQLLQSFVQIGAWALIFPGEATALPGVRVAAPAAGLADVNLKAVAISQGGSRGLRNLKQLAQPREMQVGTLLLV